MPLFDLGPKESRRALYGRDAEVESLVRLIRNGRWSVILGPRMVGKTSLAKAGAHQSGVPSVYVNLWGVKGVAGLLDALGEGINSNKPLLRRVRDTLRRIEGLNVLGTGITIAPPSRPLRTVHEILDALGGAHRRTVVILDEVQELAASSGALLKLLANVFNTRPRVTFVFTGSVFGLIRTLLAPTTSSPLFGRSPVRIDLRPFDRDEAFGFLARGFREYGAAPAPEVVRRSIEHALDGSPGWLTYYGNCVAVQRMDLADAERATVQEGMKVARSEIAHFLQGRDSATHWTALRVLTRPVTWSELRDGLAAARGSRPNDHSLSNVLRSLREAGLVEQTAETYQIGDPMVRAFVREARRAPS